jgi:hypothetical protein
MTTIALPPVGSPPRRGATDLVAASALVALTASADVVDHDAITGPYPVHSRTDRLHDPRRLVPADHSLIRLWTGPKMLSVDGSQVTAADCRRTHGENHLTASGTRIGNLANIDLTSTWEENTAHNDSVPADVILALCHSQLSTASSRGDEDGADTPR